MTTIGMILKNSSEVFTAPGLADNLGIPLVGATPARIRMPHKNHHGEYDNWSRTALPWMSIGYETEVPPISMLTFYNTIANNGVMMRPRFVQRVVKDGKTIMELPPEVMRQHICKDKTLHEIQTILRQVVSVGLGKKAGSKSFEVSGKTGTAQISKGANGYKTGGVNYLLSFAGYFPSNDPKYSCIVCIQKSGSPASGGGMSGVVFHNIAEGIMSQNLKLSVSAARDSASVFVPEVKSGNILAADYVLSHIGIPTNSDWDGNYADGNPIWGRAKDINHRKLTLYRTPSYSKSEIPDVSDMGARDAVYLIESRGVKVRIHGCGEVVSQSLPPGHKIRKGESCDLILENK
jgi:cell division protein FtsI (penicillin-binding protein 3)